MTAPPLLQVSGLTITRSNGTSRRDVIRNASFDVQAGNVLGIIGESGAGKTSLALALMGLLDKDSVEVNGKIIFSGKNLLDLTEDGLCAIRGAGMGMIFQDSTGALDPSMKVLDQVAETVRLHLGVNRAKARKLALDILTEAGVSEEVLTVAPYAHQLSGGLCQRSMIAAALAGRPDVLIADEPTSSLDVTLQAQIISLLNKHRLATGMAIVFVSHDLALVSGFADEIVVLHSGEIVEFGSCGEVLGNPDHPYTKQLISAWDYENFEGGASLAAR